MEETKIEQKEPVKIDYAAELALVKEQMQKFKLEQAQKELATMKEAKAIAKVIVEAEVKEEAIATPTVAVTEQKESKNWLQEWQAEGYIVQRDQYTNRPFITKAREYWN